MHDKYVRFDWAIKRLLRQKANFVVLEGFLTVFIGEEVKIEEILESESNQLTESDKFNRVDIKARNSKGEIIIVEVQNTRESHFLERILYGAAKAVTEHVQLGDTYGQVRKVYSISIVYFDLGQGSDYVYVGQSHLIGMHTSDELKVSVKEKSAFVTKTAADIFPEYIVIRVNQFNQVAKSPMEEWMAYLKSGVISDAPKAPGLAEARRRLQYYEMSDAERQAYDRHVDSVMLANDAIGTAKEEGFSEGMQKGLEKGLEKGRIQQQIFTAKSLISMGLDDNAIAAATGLPKEKVAELRKE